MESLKISKASKEFSKDGVALILSTMGDFGIYASGFGYRDRALKALKGLYILSENRFSHQHALFAMRNSKPAGMVVLFDYKTLIKAMAITAAHLLRVYCLKEVFAYLTRVFPYRSDEHISSEELYIAHLAVFLEFHRQGIGTFLLDYAQREAQTRGKRILSLLVKMENQPAIRLYKKFGFKIVERLDHPDREAHTGSAGDYKMMKYL